MNRAASRDHWTSSELHAGVVLHGVRLDYLVLLLFLFFLAFLVLLAHGVVELMVVTILVIRRVGPTRRAIGTPESTA